MALPPKMDEGKIAEMIKSVGGGADGMDTAELQKLMTPLMEGKLERSPAPLLYNCPSQSAGVMGGGAEAPIRSGTRSSTKKTDSGKRADAHTYDKGYKKWEQFDVDSALEECDVPSGWEDVCGDGGLLKKIITPGEGTATPQNGIEVVYLCIYSYAWPMDGLPVCGLSVRVVSTEL